MEKSIITTGKTIDEAIAAALAKLGMDRDSVSVTVLEQAKAGFFGIGRVDAKVQVTYEAPDLKPAAEPKAAAPVNTAPRIALSSASRSKPKAAKPAPKAEPKPVEKKAEAPKAEAAPRPVEKKTEAPRKPAEKKAAAAPRAERAPRAPKAEAAPRAEVKAERTYAPAEPGSNEEKIEQFIKGLLENMGSKAVPHCWSEAEGSYRVDLTGEGLAS